MAYTTIDKPSEHFDITNWTGNATDDRAITGLDFQPDLVWIKDRVVNGNYHDVYDSTRGATKRIFPNEPDAEGTEATGLKSFTSDGYTLGTNSDVNANDNSDTYIGWSWKANGGSRTTNTESGDNPAGGYQANTTAGFSIVDYVGTGSVGTKTHGLGAVPQMIIVKNRDQADAWMVYHEHMSDAPETDYMVLNTYANPADNADRWNDTAPTSSVFTIATDHSVNADGENYIAYLWTEIQGYSKFGFQTGNGNADGPFHYTGFKPKFVITKLLDTDLHRWIMYNTGNESYNQDALTNLYADSPGSDAASASGGGRIDYLSNGFKLRHTSFDGNYNNATYIWIAFAHQPFVTSGGVPCTAR